MNARKKLFAALSDITSPSFDDRNDRKTELSDLHDRLSQLSYGSGSAEIESFITRAEAAGSQVFRCATLGDARELLLSHIGSERRCVLAEDDLLTEMDIAAGLTISGCSQLAVTDAVLAQDSDAARRIYAEAEFGITIAHAGLADSGAIVISSSGNESRAVSLLPIEHVALLPASKILPSLSQAVPIITALQSAEGNSAITLVGGPSKTADIEKVLVTGVHGPAVFTIIVIDKTA